MIRNKLQNYGSFLALLFLALTFSQSPSFAAACEIPQGIKAASAAFQDCVASGHMNFTPELLAPQSESVVYLGEQHIDGTSKRFLTDHLFALKAMGYSHLAIEFLNQSSQGLIDALCRSEISKEEFIARFTKEWRYPSEGENYHSALSTACQAGFKIVALDVRDQIAPIFEKVRQTADGARDRKENTLRDLAMAKKIATVLQENPGAHILVWSGALHGIKNLKSVKEPAIHLLFGPRSQPQILLEDYGIASRSFRFESALNLLNSTSLLNKSNVFYWAAHQRGLGSDYHFVRTEESLISFDGVLLMNRYRQSSKPN